MPQPLAADLSADLPAALPGALAAELLAFLQHLRVERRLAPRTVAMYREALLRLQASADAAGIELAAAQPQHIRGWVGQLRTRGLAQAARFPWSRTAQETAAVYRRALPQSPGGAR